MVCLPLVLALWSAVYVSSYRQFTLNPSSAIPSGVMREHGGMLHLEAPRHLLQPRRRQRRFDGSNYGQFEHLFGYDEDSVDGLYVVENHPMRLRDHHNIMRYG